MFVRYHRIPFSDLTIPSSTCPVKERTGVGLFPSQLQTDSATFDFLREPPNTIIQIPLNVVHDLSFLTLTTYQLDQRQPNQDTHRSPSRKYVSSPLVQSPGCTQVHPRSQEARVRDNPTNHPQQDDHADISCAYSYFINEEDEIRYLHNPDFYFKYFLTKNSRYNDFQRFAFNGTLWTPHP